MGDTPNVVWNLYFASEFKNLINNKNNPELSLSNNEIFIFQCIFRDFNASSIHFNSKNAKIMHSECFFDSCRSEKGPALYIFNCDCSVVQRRFCTKNCYASIFGHHTYCCLKTLETRCLNYIEDCSAIECGDTTGSSVIYQESGKMKILFANISDNKSGGSTALSVRSQNFEKLAFSTIVRNSASYIATISLNEGSSYNIEDCNILNNYQGDEISGAIFLRSSLNMNGCTIFENTGSEYMFYIEGPFQVTIRNSFYDDLSSNQEITTDNCMETSKFNSLNHYDSYDCAVHPVCIKVKCSLRKCSFGNGFIHNTLIVLISKR